MNGRITTIKEWKAFLIKENATLDTLDYDLVVTEQYIDKLLMDSINIEYLAFLFKDENSGFENIEDDDIVMSDKFKTWAKNKFIDACDEFDSKLREYVNIDNTIELYRSIKVNDNWINELETTTRNLGIYWTFNENAAEAHWGHNNDEANVEIVLQTIIELKYVNLIDTFRLNIEPLNEEDEIRLIANSPVKLEKILVDGEEITLSNFIKNKIFKA